MAFLSIIRRWHKREHVPIREISRRLGVSRNIICKWPPPQVARHQARVRRNLSHSVVSGLSTQSAIAHIPSGGASS